jgi:hypothetical protein
MAKSKKAAQTLENTAVKPESKTDFTEENTKKAEENADFTKENNGVTKENEPSNSDFTPNWNVRNARVTDIQYITSFATEGKKVNEALSEVVKLAQNNTLAPVLKDDEEIIVISEELYNYANDTDATLEDTIQRLFDELKATKEMLQTEKENTANALKQVESQTLQPDQAIITFDAKTAENIRKARPFISKQNYITYEKNNNRDFINKLANHAVNKVLRIDFDNIINAL